MKLTQESESTKEGSPGPIIEGWKIGHVKNRSCSKTCSYLTSLLFDGEKVLHGASELSLLHDTKDERVRTERSNGEIFRREVDGK